MYFLGKPRRRFGIDIAPKDERVGTGPTNPGNKSDSILLRDLCHESIDIFLGDELGDLNEELIFRQMEMAIIGQELIKCIHDRSLMFLNCSTSASPIATAS